MKATSRISSDSSSTSVYDRALLVEKEEIQALTFPANEVLESEEQIRERSQKIHRATSLGNLEKHKVYIIFEDAIGLKKTSTTIWAQTEKKILLKGGVSIPVNRIWEIDI